MTDTVKGPAKGQVANPNLFNFEETIGDSVESKLKFKPRPELDYLCKGYLVKVELLVNEAPTVGEDGLASTWEYAGYKVPTLHLQFVQEPTKEDNNERFYDHYVRVFTNTKKNNEEVEPKKIVEHYQNAYGILRHIANAFKTHKNYNPEAKITAVDFLNTNIKERLESITAYFESWVNLFNGTDGTGFAKQPLIIKLVASSTGTYLTLPGFVREGFIEKFVDGRKPTVELKPGESVTLVRADKKKAAADGTAAPEASGAAPINKEVEDMLNKYR